MAFLNLLNRKNVKMVDSALEKVSGERDEARSDKQGREKRERDHQEFMKHAISRMKSGEREKFLNRQKEAQKKGVLDARLVPIKDAKVRDDAGTDAFREAIKDPVHLRVHADADKKVSGKEALKGLKR